MQPEENQTFEIGAEIAFSEKGTISLVYFNRKEEQFIDFVDTGGFVFKYRNIENIFNASGLELVSQFKVFKKLDVNLNATYTKLNEDLSLRIPEIKVNARIDYKLTEVDMLSISYQFNDERKDLFFNNNTFESDLVNLKAFSLIDVYLSHKLMDQKLTVFTNISNLFNESYQELFGFNTRGRNVNMGFRLNL